MMRLVHFPELLCSDLRLMYGVFARQCQCFFCQWICLPWYMLKCAQLMPLTFGMFLWHAGETVHRNTTSAPSLLSEHYKERCVVYNALGYMVLSAGRINVEWVRWWAYPILVGCLYGTLNNVLTVSACPEYYSLGHRYSKRPFKHHVLCTHSLWIKPLVTGCYGSQAVTICGGLALMLMKRGSLHALPSLMETVVAVGVALTLCHCAAVLCERRIETLYARYGALAGCRPDDASLLDSTWVAIHPRGCDRELDRVARLIDDYVTDEKIPMRLLKPWASNAARNRAGYLCGILGFIVLLLFY